MGVAVDDDADVFRRSMPAGRAVAPGTMPPLSAIDLRRPPRPPGAIDFRRPPPPPLEEAAPLLAIRIIPMARDP